MKNSKVHILTIVLFYFIASQIYPYMHIHVHEHQAQNKIDICSSLESDHNDGEPCCDIHQHKHQHFKGDWNLLIGKNFSKIKTSVALSIIIIIPDIEKPFKNIRFTEPPISYIQQNRVTKLSNRPPPAQA